MIDRRTVLKGLAAGVFAAGVPAGAQKAAEVAATNRPIRIWDIHSHFEALEGDTAEGRMEILVRHMDRLGIERLILSQGFGEYMNHPTPQQVRQENDRVMAAVRRFPDSSPPTPSFIAISK